MIKETSLPLTKSSPVFLCIRRSHAPLFPNHQEHHTINPLTFHREWNRGSFVKLRLKSRSIHIVIFDKSLLDRLHPAFCQVHIRRFTLFRCTAITLNHQIHFRILLEKVCHNAYILHLIVIHESAVHIERDTGLHEFTKCHSLC